MASVTLLREEEKPFTDAEIAEIKDALREIDHCDNGTIGYQDDTCLEWDGDTRWALPEDELQEIAKRFAVSIRAIGREDGCAFVQVVCVDDEGDVIQSESIEYAL